MGRKILSDEECRALVNAALLHLAKENGGQLVIHTSKLLDVAQGSTLGLNLSDDDQWLTIKPVESQ